MYAYTICFIRQNSRILLLNRQAAPWMGAWNGVGGKLEAGEDPLSGVLREVAEETGIILSHAQYKGVVSWVIDGVPKGGMYAFSAELPESCPFPTPRPTPEGILDWKEMDWIMHPDNRGVASNLPRFLPALLNDAACYDHRCRFEQGRLTGFQSAPLGEPAAALERP
jgi:8-oxo-dGTP diphosphatase